MPGKDEIRLALPCTDEDELNEIRSVLASGYLTQGPKVAEFEGTVSDYVGSKYAFAMSSCTTALHLSLVALGIGPGDEVLVPDFTFPATANVVVQQGAKPVLVDIRLDTFAMDVEDAAHKVTTRTKAILPVHPFGLPADMDPILDLARAHGLGVVEDAATAIGARYKGRCCGAMGDLGCFSFHPRKVLTTGEGGMIVTDNDVLAEKIQLLRSHGGIRRAGRFTFEAAGYNYRLSDIQGAMGVAQMRKINEMIERRRHLASQLSGRLAGCDVLRLPLTPPGHEHIFQSYVVLVAEQVDRDRLIGELRAQGIESTLGTYALHAQPLFQRALGHTPGDLPNSYLAYRNTLALPLYVQMTEQDLDRIATGLVNGTRVCKRRRGGREAGFGD